MSFHVPEHARIQHGTLALHPADFLLAPHGGAFLLDSPEPGWTLFVLATDGTQGDAVAIGWEHVSVHARRGPVYQDAKVRTPNWREMCHVKDAFWDGDDVVMQLHPRRAVYVNHHPHVLHLWRHHTAPIPEPPAELVGALSTP